MADLDTMLACITAEPDPAKWTEHGRAELFPLLFAAIAALREELRAADIACINAKREATLQMDAAIAAVRERDEARAAAARLTTALDELEAGEDIAEANRELGWGDGKVGMLEASGDPVLTPEEALDRWVSWLRDADRDDEEPEQYDPTEGAPAPAVQAQRGDVSEDRHVTPFAVQMSFAVNESIEDDVERIDGIAEDMPTPPTGFASEVSFGADFRGIGSSCLRC